MINRFFFVPKRHPYNSFPNNQTIIHSEPTEPMEIEWRSTAMSCGPLTMGAKTRVIALSFVQTAHAPHVRTWLSRTENVRWLMLSKSIPLHAAHFTTGCISPIVLEFWQLLLFPDTDFFFVLPVKYEAYLPNSFSAQNMPDGAGNRRSVTTCLCHTRTAF